MSSDYRLKLADAARNLVLTGRFMRPLIGVVVLLSGFRAGSYTQDHLLAGGPPIANTLLIAWLCGALSGPLLISWLPGKALATKGLMAGLLGLLVYPASCFFLHIEPLDVFMALLVIPSVTLFMITKHIYPIPLAGVALAAGIWITARFI